MKRRYLFILLFGAPILLACTVISLAVFGAVAGLLWLFVAGDSPWPPFVNTILVASFLITFAATSLVLTYQAYVFGRRQEAQASLTVKPALTAVGATALLILAIVAYQWRVGNIGAKSDSVLCSEFCQGTGFAGSGLPPRNSGEATCTCFDARGREVARVPIQDLVTHK